MAGLMACTDRIARKDVCVEVAYCFLCPAVCLLIIMQCCPVKYFKGWEESVDILMCSSKTTVPSHD